MYQLIGLVCRISQTSKSYIKQYKSNVLTLRFNIKRFVYLKVSWIMQNMLMAVCVLK